MLLNRVVKLGMSRMVNMIAYISVNRWIEIIIVLSVCVSDMLRYMIIMNEGIDFMNWCSEMRQFLMSWVNMMGLEFQMISCERYDSKLRIVLNRCNIVLIHWGDRSSYWHWFVMYDFVRLWILDYLVINDRAV